MLFLMVLFIILTGCTTNRNAGSTLFYDKYSRAECWNTDDVAKLWARKAFEQAVPPSVDPEAVNIKYVTETLRYFRRALRSVDKDVDTQTATILKLALADAIGAHLRSEILPTVRFAYYAGYVPYRHARKVEDFFDEIKIYLNTQGLGWKPPERIPKWTNLTVAKILIGAVNIFDPCASLVLKRDSRSCLHLPVPKLDNIDEPSALALPFKSGGLVSLFSPNSENILLKYYTTACRCILNSSPKTCRHADFVNFNNQMWHWMKRDVAPHLNDEKLYATYGGILRIAAAVQNYGKGLSRRNLFDSDDDGLTKWHPWKTLSDSYVYINADWTPRFYLGLILVVLVAIGLLQICYNYMLGDTTGCMCKGKSNKTTSLAYANVESNVPAMLRHQSSILYSDKKRAKRTTSKTKTSSLGSIRTQKVFDLNENTEKLMAVIMSDNESNVDSPVSEVESDENTDEESKRSRSPPKLETSMSQLKLKKKQIDKNNMQMYSTSTMTRSNVTYCQQSDSARH
ncbi:hypothetical protein K1T71_003514 [Dendrolimus kikuchii]|uniref:Uncharacterized protein n=1 Tax=Dendrolimus kikuchii TaxID=765133 RepID=A0ACC1DBT6_9NEOP|nr:hypothetical protein K1T71_003514 [Dendrolimus kikuchii]